MLKKISLLTALVFAGSLFAITPSHADGIRVHDASGDMDDSFSIGSDGSVYRRDVRIDSFILKVDHSSIFGRHSFEDRNSDSDHWMRGRSGAPNVPEWIWWLDQSDKDKKQATGDPVVPAPEPASLLLVGSGLLALGALRRRTNHSAPIS